MHTDLTDGKELPMSKFNYQIAPQAFVYIETNAFGLNPLLSVGYAAALIAGKWPALSSSVLLYSSCSKSQLKAAHHALQPKITLPVFTSWVQCRFLIPQSSIFSSAIFWCNGKIFHSAARREVALLKKIVMTRESKMAKRKTEPTMWLWWKQSGPPVQTSA